MKPVIGMLLVLVGLTTGYLVLTNKIPNSGTPNTTTLIGNSNNVPNTSSSVPTNNQINNRYRNQNGNTSTPTVGGTPPSMKGGPFLVNSSALPASNMHYGISNMNFRASTMK